MFKIQKNIPLAPVPAKRTALTKPVQYPFEKMKVGDSFLVPAANKNAACRIANKVSVSAHMEGKRIGAKFSRRVTSEGVRIWRVA
jgi:hypothetical protein